MAKKRRCDVELCGSGASVLDKETAQSKKGETGRRRPRPTPTNRIKQLGPVVAKPTADDRRTASTMKARTAAAGAPTGRTVRYRPTVIASSVCWSSFYRPLYRSFFIFFPSFLRLGSLLHLAAAASVAALAIH